MNRPPIKPQGGYGPDREKADIHRRLREIESRSGDLEELSGSVDAHFTDLSGSVDSAIRAISGGGLTFVTHDTTLTGDGTGGSPLSAAALSSSIDSAIVSLSGTVNARFVSLSGSVDGHFNVLSGTVDARFKNWNYSNIGITGSVTITEDLRVSGSITGSGNMVLQSTGPVTLTLNADTDNVTESDVAQIRFLQDGAQVGGIVGFDSNNDLIVGPNVLSASRLHLAWATSGFTPTTSDFRLTVGQSGLVSQRDLYVSGSLTGSGDVLLSRNIGVNGALTASMGGLFSRAVDMSAHLINNVTDPVSAQDAATKNYVDALSGTINSRFINLTGSLISGLANLSGTINSALVALSGTNIVALSQSIDAAFVYAGDPLRSYVYEDDYVADKLSSRAVIGGASLTHITHEHGHPGILRLSTTTAGTDSADVYLCETAATGPTRFGGGRLLYDAVVRVPVLDTGGGGENAMRRAGVFIQTSADDPSDGAWFELNHSAYSDNEWRFRTAATSSQAAVKTGVTAGALRWYRLGIEVSPDGDAVTGSIYCSGSLVGSVRTRTYVTPGGVAGMAPGIIVLKKLGSSARTMDVDYQSIRQSFTGSRY